METFYSENTSNFTSNNFVCEICDFICSKKGDWNRHTQTRKHEETFKKQNLHQKHQTNNDVKLCVCGKTFTSRSGLWKHKKVCDMLTQISSEANEALQQSVSMEEMKGYVTVDMFMTLLNQNQNFQMMLFNQSKETQQTLIDQNSKMIDLLHNTGNNNNNHNNNNTNHSYNKTFNLQLFLNETCKNAMNMSDFIENISISLEDLEETGRIGYAEGISKLFIKNLNNLEVTDRPIHCSDSKRDTLYVKNENVWKKEDENNVIITNAIKEVAKKNSMQIGEWRKKYPEYNDPDSRDSDKYQKMILNAMPGSSKRECDNNYAKIIHNIAKSVVIQKN
jgi:acetolactate synthase regulatory subunit